MTATNHDDQLGEIYSAMLNELNCTLGVSLSRFHCSGSHGHGLWPSWFVAVMVFINRYLYPFDEIPVLELRASPAIWDHTVLYLPPDTSEAPRLSPSQNAGTRFTYPGGIEGLVDLGCPASPTP